MAMYGSQNKWCFVPRCTNTSKSTPNKTFVRVPQEYERKKRWFKAARRDMPKSKSEFFCCEDHFKLEEDMENYVRFKLMGGKIIMKRDVVPHIFVCQPDRKRTATDGPTRSLPLKRERKFLVEEAQAAHEQLDAQHLALDTPSTSKFDKDSEEDISIKIEPPCIEEEEYQDYSSNTLESYGQVENNDLVNSYLAFSDNIKSEDNDLQFKEEDSNCEITDDYVIETTPSSQFKLIQLAEEIILLSSSRKHNDVIIKLAEEKLKQVRDLLK